MELLVVILIIGILPRSPCRPSRSAEEGPGRFREVNARNLSRVESCYADDGPSCHRRSADAGRHRVDLPLIDGTPAASGNVAVTASSQVHVCVEVRYQIVRDATGSIAVLLADEQGSCPSSQSW